MYNQSDLTRKDLEIPLPLFTKRSKWRTKRLDRTFCSDLGCKCNHVNPRKVSQRQHMTMTKTGRGRVSGDNSDLTLKVEFRIKTTTKQREIYIIRR